MKHLLTLLLVFVCTAVGTAQIYTYEYSGYITTANSTLPVTVNQAFSGRFSFADVPDQNASSTRGQYSQKASIYLSLGTITFDFKNEDAYILVYNNDSNYDQFQFNCMHEWYQGDFKFRDFWIDLSDWTENTALNSTALPPHLDPAAFDRSEINLQGWTISTNASIYIIGKITEITLVPEPASASILILGAALIAAKRRR